MRGRRDQESSICHCDGSENTKLNSACFLLAGFSETSREMRSKSRFKKAIGKG